MVHLVVDCNSVSLSSFFSIVKRVMFYIQIFVPIILLVFASISIIKIIINPDQKDGLIKVYYKFIAAAIVFFVPLLVDVTMNLIGDNSISSCWKNAEDRVQGSTKYYKTTDKEGNTIFIDPSEYEKGNSNNNSNNSNNNSNNNNTNTNTNTNNTDLKDNAKIVFIGNSKTFASDIPGVFNSIASNIGYKFKISKIVEGGKTLEWHSLNNSDKLSKNYDVAILQEQTDVMEYNLDVYKSGAEKVASLLRAKNDKIGIYVRQCWGLKSNVGNYLHQSVQTNADEVAKAISANLIKDGTAWDTYNNYDVLYSDDTHQSDAGAYLAAACILKSISNADLSKVTDYGKVDKNTAKEFLKIANNVC